MLKTKIISAFLVIVIALSLTISGCGVTNTPGTSSQEQQQNGTETDTTETGTENNLEEVKLRVYMRTWSTPYEDNDKVVEEINKKLKEKINATMEVIVELDAEAAKKIPLMLAAGEEFDLVSMGSAAFASEVSRGGLMILDDLLFEYLPETMNSLTKQEHEALKFNGHYYKVPGGFDWFLPQGYLIRGDLREKYNIPEVKDINGLKKYMEVLMEKEPGVIPFNTSAADVLNLWLNFINASGYMAVYQPLGMYYDYNADDVTVVYEHELEQFKDFLRTAKEFADKGFWSKNAYAGKTISTEAFKAGTSFVATGHVVTANDMAIMLRNIQPDWKVEFVRIPDNYRQRPMTAGSGTIPSTSKNPERMLMALKLMRTDREIHDLLMYGIEGVHYTLDAEGRVNSTQVGTEKYPPDQFPLAWSNRNLEFIREVNGSLKELMEIQNSVDEMSKMSKIYGFTFDKTPVATEVAVMSDIYQEYKYLFNFGAFDDVDRILAEYTEKMKAAGADKVKAEMQRQVDEYLKNIQ